MKTNVTLEKLISIALSTLLVLAFIPFSAEAESDQSLPEDAISETTPEDSEEYLQGYLDEESSDNATMPDDSVDQADLTTANEENSDNTTTPEDSVDQADSTTAMDSTITFNISGENSGSDFLLRGFKSV